MCVGQTLGWPMGSLKMVYKHKVYCVSTAGKEMTLPSLKKHPWSKITVILWGSGEISPSPEETFAQAELLWEEECWRAWGLMTHFEADLRIPYGCRGWRILNLTVSNLKSCRKEAPTHSLTNIKWHRMNHFIIIHIYSGDKFLNYSWHTLNTKYDAEMKAQKSQFQPAMRYYVFF